MLIGHSMPTPSIDISGGSWLTADGGAACCDGRPARRARLDSAGSAQIMLTFAAGFVPGIIAVLGLRGVAAGVSISATTGAGATLGGNSAAQPVVQFPDGTFGAWIVTGNTVNTSAVRIPIPVAGTIDVGEIFAAPMVEVGIRDGWDIATVDPSEITRTRGMQRVGVARPSYRVLRAQMAGMETGKVRGGALSGTDLETVAAALAGNRRACVIPQYRNMATKAMDYALAQRTAIYGSAVEVPGAVSLQRQWFASGITFEEVPA